MSKGNIRMPRLLEERDFDEVFAMVSENQKILKRDLQAFKEWLRALIGVQWRYFDLRTLYSAFFVRNKIRQDYDHITIIVGKEGTGKSTFASQYGSLISPEMSIKHVCFNPKDLIIALRTAKKYDTLWVDEGALFLFSRESMNKDNKLMVKLLTICRQLNLHLMLCVPNFWILDTYLRDHRVDHLFWINKRGHLQRFSSYAVSIISTLGARSKSIQAVLNTKKVSSKWRYMGYFVNKFGETPNMSQEQYLSHKSANMDSFMQDLEREVVLGEPKKRLSDSFP